MGPPRGRALSLTDTMTKRERVEAALRLQETDRVPVYDFLCSDEAIRHFAGAVPSVGKEGMRLKCRAIAAMLDMTRAAEVLPVHPGESADEDGFVRFQIDHWRSGGIRHRPFGDEAGARRWLDRALRRLSQPLGLRRCAEEHRRSFREAQAAIGDDTVQLAAQTGTGLDEVREALGLELFSYIEADHPGMISTYMELWTDRQVRIIHEIADPRLSPCALTYGDIACKARTLHSPGWLRGEFFPRLKRLNDAWHAHGVKCLFHSDGYLMEVMDDLIAAGIDGLNPVETLAGMDLAEVKARCGARIFLAGGIDSSQLLARASPAEVKEACRTAIRAARPGYFIGSTTELDDGARLENILAMLEAARESSRIS